MRNIYIDLDGVLADFDLRYFEVTGKDFINVPSKLRWSLLEGKQEGFYAGIRPYLWSIHFVERIFGLTESHGFKVQTLSALPSAIEFKTARDEKLDWVSAHFPEIEGSFIAKSSADKKRYSAPGDILIDDNPRNVAQWMKAGGMAIRHLNFEDSLIQLGDLL